MVIQFVWMKNEKSILDKLQLKFDIFIISYSSVKSLKAFLFDLQLLWNNDNLLVSPQCFTLLFCFFRYKEGDLFCWSVEKTTLIME